MIIWNARQAESMARKVTKSLVIAIHEDMAQMKQRSIPLK